MFGQFEEFNFFFYISNFNFNLWLVSLYESHMGDQYYLLQTQKKMSILKLESV